MTKTDWIAVNVDFVSHMSSLRSYLSLEEKIKVAFFGDRSVMTFATSVMRY